MPKKLHVTATVNGESAEFLCEPRESLLEVLRDRLHLTGAKEGCNNGNCGACTVLVEDRPVLSCLVLAAECEGAKIITVAMGSPRQEILMRDCRQVYPDALYMGVGGTYDVFTGHVKRAPKVWQNLGLEWLYRLLSQPSRITRQLRLLRYLGWHYSGRL